jgi:iron complex outermembrane receptor protein
VPRTGNAERSVHAGLELDASVGLARGLQLKGNATISKNRFKEFDEFVTFPDFSVEQVSRADNPIAGSPDNSGNVGLLYVQRGLSAEMYLAYVGKAYADNSSGIVPGGEFSDDLIIDSYTLLDATLGYEFSGGSTFAGLKISVALNNILDQKVLQYGNVGVVGPQYFPAATRHVYIGIRYTLQ